MLWVHDWRFCRKHECCDRDLIPHLHDRFSARQSLQRIKANVQKMLALRVLLAQEEGAGNLSRMSDDAVIDRLAGLLASRRLHVHGALARTAAAAAGQSLVAGTPSDDRAAAAPPFPISGRKPSTPAVPSRESAIHPDPLTFPANTNVAAQAAALVAAATMGVAACYI